jgi:hypothetical protein
MKAKSLPVVPFYPGILGRRRISGVYNRGVRAGVLGNDLGTVGHEEAIVAVFTDIRA